MAERVDKLQEQQATATKEFSALKGDLEKTETYTRRPPATGGGGGADI